MSSLQQWKQRKLNLGPVADGLPSRSSEEFIASHLSESPTGQIRLMEYGPSGYPDQGQTCIETDP